MEKDKGASRCAYDPELRKDIATLAHAHWEREGRPDGKDVEHWLLAEAELLATLEPVEAEEVSDLPPESMGRSKGRTGAGRARTGA